MRLAAPTAKLLVPSLLHQSYPLRTLASNAFITSTSPLPHKAHPPSCRSFSTTPPTRIDKKRRNKAAADLASAANNDPFDFSALETGIAQALERLKDNLSRLRSGGRFNPDVLEGLRVVIGKGGKETVKLGDLAQVVPRGRAVVVFVGEAEHIKPITSAILSSPHSLNPVSNPHNPLELSIPIPPPTAESRQQTLAAASKAGEVAASAVQSARGAQKKVLRAMELAKAAGPDDLVKAGARMEKVVEEGLGKVRTIVDGARKALEKG